jgi:microcystin-dependent protein
MANQASCAFPDSTYTASNLPQAATLKADILELETKHNAHDNSTSEHGASGAVVGLTTLKTYVPSGVIFSYGGSSAPTGFLLCDGTAISRTTYSDLYAIIGTSYGVGDGSTTFNVPNLKGKIPVGYNSSDTSYDNLGETGGAKTYDLSHTHTGPSHTHTGPNHSHTIAHTHTATTGGASDGNTTSTASDHSHSYSGSGNTGASPNTSDMNTGDENATRPSTSHIHSFSWSGTTGNSGSHNHTTTDHNHSLTTSGSSVANTGDAGTGATGASGTDNTGSGGSSTQSVLNPYLVVNYIIKT